MCYIYCNYLCHIMYARISNNWKQYIMLNAVHVMISAEMLALCLCLYHWINLNAYQVFLKRLIRTFDCL